MENAHPSLVETTVDGARTRNWVLEATQCRDLAAHRIARVGYAEARLPYCRVRLQPPGSFVMVCLSGSGYVLLEGRWQKVGPGTVCMAPPRVLNAFHASAGVPWVFTWIRYDEPAQVSPLVGASSPVKVRGGDGLARSVLGLREEWEACREPAVLHHWIELLQTYTRRLAQPFHRGERLRHLWQKIADDLAAPWTLSRLARQAHMSEEHLRRTCLRELGRTPMQQVAAVRMIAARRYLDTTEDKLEFLAERLGYGNAFIFSRAFKRIVGMAPAEYRQRR